jgi:hypothetical protein
MPRFRRSGDVVDAWGLIGDKNLREGWHTIRENPAHRTETVAAPRQKENP